MLLDRKQILYASRVRAKDKLKYYLGYQVLMEALNVVLNFTGIAEDGLTYAFEYMGLPKWLAEIAARAIVFFLL